MTVAVVVYGLLSRGGYGRALALGGSTPVGAALVFGGIALPTFFAVAVGSALLLGLALLGRVRGSLPLWPRVPAGRCLLMFTGVAVLTTLTAPLLFDGLVVQPSVGETTLTAGLVTRSNIAQMTYLVLGICVIFHLARSRSTSASLVGLAAGLTTVLSFWAWLGTQGAPFPTGFFDNSPTYVFQATLPGGAPRVRGILSEPAGLAASSLVTLAYGASRLTSASPGRRLPLIVLMAMAGYLGAISTSTTFWVAGAALVVVAVVVHGSLFVTGRTRLGKKTVAGLCALAVASLWLLPLAAEALSSVVEEKVTSSSYEDRTGSDASSFQLVRQTIGYGVGVGSNRGSSFLASLLSTVGVVGTAFFVAAVWLLLRGSWRDTASRPAAWALVALLITKVVSSPDLGDTSGILYLAMGVLAHAAARRSAPRAHAPAHPAPPISRPTTVPLSGPRPRYVSQPNRRTNATGREGLE